MTCTRRGFLPPERMASYVRKLLALSLIDEDLESAILDFVAENERDFVVIPRRVG